MSRKRDGLRDRWRAAILSSRTISDGTKVLLLLMAESMSDKGYVSVPRDHLAETLNVHPSRVTERISQAIKTGLLAKIGGGYHDRAAEYGAVLPSEGNCSAVTLPPVKVTARQSPSRVKGDGSAVTISSHLPIAADQPESDTKVTAQQSPNTRAYVNGTEPPTTTAPHLETSETTAQPPDDSPPISAGAGTAPHTAVHNTEISPGLGSAVLSEASTDPLLDEPRNECTQHPEWNPDQTCRACKRWLHDHDGWTYRQRIANSLTMARTAP